MIFVQQHFDNFLSHIDIILLFFLFFFLSPLFLINEKREKKKLSHKLSHLIVQITLRQNKYPTVHLPSGCLDVETLFQSVDSYKSHHCFYSFIWKKLYLSLFICPSSSIDSNSSLCFIANDFEYVCPLGKR